jgi:NAD-dependent SIR2 family protein deacetylase
MNGSPYAVCDTCHSTFPREWVWKKEALERNGKFFCCPSCYHKYRERLAIVFDKNIPQAVSENILRQLR